MYNLHDIVVLDDPFSALDGNTENAVVDNLLGPNGWFKKRNTTVFLVTNSGKPQHPYVYTAFKLIIPIAQHFHLADEILVLEKGRILSRGSWDELKNTLSNLSKFTFTQTAKRPETISNAAKLVPRPSTDAENDLYRKTGDFSLYCEPRPHTCVERRRADQMTSLLSEIRWLLERGPVAWTYNSLFFLHYLSAVLGQILDRRLSK